MGTREFAFAAVLLSIAAVAEAEAACPAAFTQRLDARGREFCVATDRIRTFELRERQQIDQKVLRDSQTRLTQDQQELARELSQAQRDRSILLRGEQRRRQFDPRQ